MIRQSKKSIVIATRKWGKTELTFNKFLYNSFGLEYKPRFIKVKVIK